MNACLREQLQNCRSTASTFAFDPESARIGGDEFVVMFSGLSAIESEAGTQTELVGDKLLLALSEVY